MMQMQIVNFGKHGQLKVQQMAFMLVAITLFFILAGMFFLVINFSNLKQSATEQEKENTELLITRLANSPEFSCENSFENLGTNCIDFDKVMVLKQGMEKYQRYWGDIANIEIRKVYPPEATVLCEIQNYPRCNTLRLYSADVNGTYITNFVSLCRKETEGERTYDKCELARLMIAYNQK